MNERDFIIWLNGYLEISGAKELGTVETGIIRDKLQSVFSKQTPNRQAIPFPIYPPNSSPMTLPTVGDWPSTTFITDDTNNRNAAAGTLFCASNSTTQPSGEPMVVWHSC